MFFFLFQNSASLFFRGQKHKTYMESDILDISYFKSNDFNHLLNLKSLCSGSFFGSM